MYSFLLITMHFLFCHFTSVRSTLSVACIQNRADVPQKGTVDYKKMYFLSFKISEAYTQRFYQPGDLTITSICFSFFTPVIFSSFLCVSFFHLTLCTHLFFWPLFLLVLCPVEQQEYPLNPKAVSLGELYGENNLSTNEWTDGVLSSLMRSACAGTEHTQRSSH